jgi:nitrogen fixation NifU-like protein
MKSPVNDFVGKLQEQIFEETREIYGEEVLSRWQEPKFMGRMTDASSVGRITGNCGDRMEIYLRIKDDSIEEATFFTDGCGSSVACGSVIAELATGKDLEEAAQIGGDTVLKVLGGLPEEESHCAFLAAETLMTAIHQWIVARMNAEKG